MRVIWSRPSLEDLRGIDEWLAREASPELALRTLVAIRHRVTFLESFPRAGRPYRDGQRLLRVYGTPYLIRYWVDQHVEVIRVHHEREGWQLAR